MSLAILVEALKCANLSGVRLALKSREHAREYCSQSAQRYHELMGHGLRGQDPLDFIYRQGWAIRCPSDRAKLPLAIHTEGGTRLDELLLLAIVTRALRPAKIFEIGTFMGRTTSVFVLNAPADSIVTTLDLPPDVAPETSSQAPFLHSDLLLVKQRRTTSMLHELRLEGRYQQVLCDSLAFDPTPFAGSIELGFIDGAHARQYVENDTRKMAVMMADRGLVFWHDYGGMGRFRPLTEYLEHLSHTISIYRVSGTTLAWAPSGELRKVAAT